MKLIIVHIQEKLAMQYTGLEDLKEHHASRTKRSTCYTFHKGRIGVSASSLCNVFVHYDARYGPEYEHGHGNQGYHIAILKI